ncbi:MAG: hypothetical protein WCP87_04005 [Atribacterota bacterium]
MGMLFMIFSWLLLVIGIIGLTGLEFGAKPSWLGWICLVLGIIGVVMSLTKKKK